jgi:Holliday junction resolvasome RuvABC endonuclease subunit
MRILAFDPGAERMGFAVIEGGEGKPPTYIESGIIGTPRRENEDYQPYRLRLIDRLVVELDSLLSTYTVGLIANETVPPSTSTAFASNGVQAQLAATSVTVVQAMAALNGVPVKQVSAVTVKKRIGGVKTASKVKVRNGVFHFFPEIKDQKWAEWVKVHDESDACGIGLVALGYAL